MVAYIFKMCQNSQVDWLQVLLRIQSQVEEEKETGSIQEETEHVIKEEMY